MSDTQSFPERVRVLRAKKHLSQPEFAELMGFSRGTLSAVEGGKPPSKRFVQQLEALEALEQAGPRDESHVSTGKRSKLSESLKARIGSDDSFSAKIVPTRPIPVISWAQAGQMMDYEEMPTSWQRTVPTDLPDPDAFAVQIAGDSMEPRYHAGDVAYVTPSRPLQQGDTVIARLANQGAVFKLYSRSGNTVRFSSYNPAHQPFEVPAEEILKIFPVVAVMKIVSR